MARRRSSFPLTPILGIGLLAILGIGAVIVIEGEVTILGRTLRLSDNEVQAAELPENMVRIPVSTRAIPAYTRIQGEHIVDANTGRFTTIALNRQDVGDSVITEADVRTRLVGRVLRRDKSAGRAFTESDFLPKGSRDGITAGIPPGKRGLVLPAEDVQGLMDLRTGDRFDIVATWDAATGKRQSPVTTGVTSFATSQATNPKQPTRARVEVVSDNGEVIRPVRIRQKPTTSSGLLNGQRLSATPIQEIQIAVKPEEAIRISAALQSGATLRCLLRSGHPEDEGTSTRLPTDFLPPEKEARNEDVGEVMILRGGEPERILTRRNRDPR